MDRKFSQGYFSLAGTVREYGYAAEHVGLWESEKAILSAEFGIHEELLELGCGAGRIAFGLSELGYTEVTAVDYSLRMVIEAVRLAELKGCHDVKISHGDATGLEFEAERFMGVIFGFNGMMQIPGRANRQRAMSEAYRVLRPGGRFIFTTHDRDNRARAEFWKEELRRWNKGKQASDLEDFGDVVYDAEHGMMFIHIPNKEEIEGMLRLAGFRVERCMTRSDVAEEGERVKAFSDECLFWVASKGE